MMKLYTAVRHLTLGLSRLSVQPVQQLGTPAGQPAINLVSNIQRRCFCLSSVHHHKMDTRAYPIWWHPSSKNLRWVPPKKFTEMYEYTTDPLPFPKTGGRGPNGRIWVHCRGGGRKRVFYMVDWLRGGPTEGPPLVERVIEIKEDTNRTSKIALVASGEKKRYILATYGMEVGDLVSSSQVLTKTPVQPKNGDSYPVGSLPLGTMLCCVERLPGEGAIVGRAGGVSCELVRKIGEKCIIRMPSKREMMISAKCTAVVGRIGNETHDKEPWGKAGAKRLAGYRPRSGRWHRKTGIYGRKIKPIKPTISYEARYRERTPVTRVRPPFQMHIY